MSNGQATVSIDDLVKALKDALDARDKDKQTFIKSLGEVIGTLADVIEVAGWVIPFASTAAGIIKNVVGQQSEANSALQAIQDEITHLIKDLHNVTEHIDMEDITVRENDVQTTLDLLKVHGRTDPNVQTRMPHDAIALLRDFGSRPFWTRPFFPELVTKNAWIPSDPPVDAASGSVLDPKLILAAYMRSITMWLCTLALMDPTSRPPELDLDIDDVIDNLTTYHDEMTAGLHIGRTPQVNDIATFSVVGTAIGPWFDAGQPVGALDVYTGLQLISVFAPWSRLVDRDAPTFQDDFNRAAARFVLGSAARQKAIYIGEGLLDMWTLLQRVRRIAGRPVERVNPHSSWSLRELHSAVLPLLPPPDPSELGGNRIDAVTVMHGLDASIRRPPVPPGGRRSLREAIQAATP